jgi:hypothetical protein
VAISPAGRDHARIWPEGGVARRVALRIAGRLWACARRSQGSPWRTLWRETLFEAGE